MKNLNNYINEALIKKHISIISEDTVDMGLDSGVLWCSCNLGAENCYSAGDYYSWAEIQPKRIYDIESYKYVSKGYVTKYNDSDNLNTLEPSDDAAWVNTHGRYRIPSTQEWEELIKNSTYRYITTPNKCVEFKSKINGNTLYFPLVGFNYNEKQLRPPQYVTIYPTNEVSKDEMFKSIIFGGRLVRSDEQSVRFRGYNIKAVLNK